MSNMLFYWQHKIHHSYLSNYIESEYHGKTAYLAFSKEWMDKHMPSGEQVHGGLTCYLLDTETQQVKECSIYAFFEEIEVFNTDYNSASCYTLKPYMYEQHFCPCHRFTAFGLDGACEGERFRIVSVTPRDSDLVLMSEVTAVDELRKRLGKYKREAERERNG